MSFTPIAEVGEFGLIDRLRAQLPDPGADTLMGIGDDAAVYRVAEGPDGKPRVHVQTTDALVEGVHFDRTFAPLDAVGHKALAVNVSDIAAMNARPRWATVALGVPSNVGVEGLEALYAGLAAAAERWGVAVVGGDVTAAPRLFVSVTVTGEAAEDAVVYRRGAEVGDLLCVTGDLGAAYAGLKVLQDEKQRFLDAAAAGAETTQPDLTGFKHAVGRQLHGQARLDAVERWAAAGVRPHALIDVSDGLASEVHHLCRASGVGAVVEAGLLPLHLDTFRAAERFGETPDVYALFGGEDYELLFAIAEKDLQRLDEKGYAVVGQVVEASEGVTVRQPDGQVTRLDAAGFRHF